MINMNDKSRVINLCDYGISWKRITQTGDEYIKANASTRILNSEIETQKDNGNKWFCGTDGLGSHASVYIDNKELREQLMFDDPDNKKTQLIVDESKCKSILDLKTDSAFKKNLSEFVITRQEKLKMMEVARKIKLNDYKKIQTLEEYCDMKF